MKSLALRCVLKHPGVGLTEHCLVKRFAETLGSLCYLFLDLILDLGYLLLDEHIGAVTLLGILVVNQRIVERIHMTGSLPYGRVHKDRRVNAHDILVKESHGIPPVTLDIVFELHAILTVVIHS